MYKRVLRFSLLQTYTPEGLNKFTIHLAAYENASIPNFFYFYLLQLKKKTLLIYSLNSHTVDITERPSCV